VLAERSAATPWRAAFIEGSSARTLTWRELYQASTAWRTARVRMGGECDRVGLAVGDPLVTAASFVAALASGVAVAPLDGEAPAGQLLEQADQLRLAALVTDRTDEELIAGAAQVGLDVWSAGFGRPCLMRARRSASRGAPSNGAAVMMATSGTTGRPKIVPLREHQLMGTARAVVAHHRIAASDRGYCPLPLFHINGLVVGVLSTVVAGSTLVVDRRFSRRSFWPTVGAHDVTWLNVVPAIIGVLARSEPPRPDERCRVRFARSAAAPLSVTTAALFEARCGVSVLETYGMTEAASQIAANPLCPADRRPGSVGRPVGVEVRVVDEAGRPVPAGTSGVVEIRGRTVVSEYWATGQRSPASWCATDDDGWLWTGDVGVLDAEGFLCLLARADDVINRGGEKIYPGEVEDVLLADERVTGAVVVARPHDIAGAEPVAFVTARVSTEHRLALVEDLYRRCAAALSRSKRPAVVMVVDILPVGPTGKVRRAELRRSLATAAQ
jgi:acyl-CoA synthetase (AMP-forming)/AMP-acid ligase II